MDSQLSRPGHARSIASRLGLLLALALTAAGGCGRDHPARDAASLIMRAEWQKHELAPGITWEHRRFPDLFEAPQSIHVLRIDLAGPARLRLVACENGPEPTSTLAERAGALAAVNGTFFRMKGPEAGTPVCFVKIDGEVRATTVGGRGMGALTITADGRVDLIRRPNVGWEEAVLPASVLVAGPIVDWDGIPRPRHETLERHPRTAVGLSPDRRTLVLATIDGRTSQAAGVTLPELREVMSALGCNRTLNLDGGGSTTMWLRERGVVNHPCDNDRFDHAGERPVATAIVIDLPPAPGP